MALLLCAVPTAQASRCPTPGLGRLVLLSDMDNGGVAAWSYLGKAVGDPTKSYRYKPDALPANNTMAHLADKPLGGYRNTTLPTPASGQEGSGAAAQAGYGSASAAAWSHAYGFLGNQPFCGTEYLGLAPQSLTGPGGIFGFMGPVDKMQQWMYDNAAEPLLSLPGISTARRLYELVAREDLISQRKLALGEAGENLLHSAGWDALNVGLMGMSLGSAAARSAVAMARTEAVEAFLAPRSATGLRTLAAEGATASAARRAGETFLNPINQPRNWSSYWNPRFAPYYANYDGTAATILHEGTHVSDIVAHPHLASLVNGPGYRPGAGILRYLGERRAYVADGSYRNLLTPFQSFTEVSHFRHLGYDAAIGLVISGAAGYSIYEHTQP